MMSHKILTKSFIIGILVFMLLNNSSLGEYQNKQQENNRQDPIPTVYGIMGDNRWFISDVTILFSYDDSRVKEIQYYLDGSWHIYNDNPIMITEDGLYNIPWFWVDMVNKSFDGHPIVFWLDQTPPTIELSKKSGGKNKIIFTADANDAISIVEKVEFYLDEELVNTDLEKPYEYNWTGEENQVVYAIGYNYAGLSLISNNLSTTPRSHFRKLNLMNMIFVLMQKAFFRFYNI